MGVIQWFQENIVSNTLMMVFLIAVIGYLVGSIRICGLELGTAGILLVALVFGHFGIEIPDLVRELGLICFVTSVGFIAGPKFFRNFKHNAASYILLGFLVIAAGALVCVAVIQVFGIPTDISVGMMTGALTSTPGLAAALEATGSDAASVGYGIAYPFGVVEPEAEELVAELFPVTAVTRPGITDLRKGTRQMPRLTVTMDAPLEKLIWFRKK